MRVHAGRDSAPEEPICNLQFAINTSKPPAPVALEGRLCQSAKPSPSLACSWPLTRSFFGVAPPCCSPCCCPSVCAAGQKGAPILFRACARRAAGDGVCRGSAVAAGRPPGGPPEAMVSPEHHHSGIDVENKLYTYYRRTRNAILCLNKL